MTAKMPPFYVGGEVELPHTLPDGKRLCRVVGDLIRTYDDVERTFPLGRDLMEITMTDGRKIRLRVELAEVK